METTYFIYNQVMLTQNIKEQKGGGAGGKLLIVKLLEVRPHSKH